MRGAIGIILNPLHDMLARFLALEVHSSDSTSMATAVMSDRDSASIVSAAFAVADFGEG